MPVTPIAGIFSSTLFFSEKRYSFLHLSDIPVIISNFNNIGMIKYSKKFFFAIFAKLFKSR